MPKTLFALSCALLALACAGNSRPCNAEIQVRDAGVDVHKPTAEVDWYARTFRCLDGLGNCNDGQDELGYREFEFRPDGTGQWRLPKRVRTFGPACEPMTIGFSWWLDCAASEEHHRNSSGRTVDAPADGGKSFRFVRVYYQFDKADDPKDQCDPPREAGRVYEDFFVDSSPDLGATYDPKFPRVFWDGCLNDCSVANGVPYEVLCEKDADCPKDTHRCTAHPANDGTQHCTPK